MKRMEPFLEDVFECFPRTSQRPCNALDAVAIEVYRQPLLKRLFYAISRWGWVVIVPAALAAALTGCYAGAAAADAEDAEALNSRDWAGQQVCGAAATAVWRGDVLECLSERPVMAVQQ